MDLPQKQLVDADIICYACGFSADSKQKSLQEAYDMLDKFMESILIFDDADFFLTGPGNFRKKYPWYKANRKNSPKPTHLSALQDYVKDVYEAEVAVGEEADDLMGKAQQGAYTCITTTDKDLDQIPGWHYNWRKNKLYWVNRDEGMMFFYKQMITGDTADNVKCIKGLGPKKAESALQGTNPDEARDVVAKLYQQHGISDQLKENAEVLWIRR